MNNSKIYSQEERKRLKWQNMKIKIGDYMIT